MKEEREETKNFNNNKQGSGQGVGQGEAGRGRAGRDRRQEEKELDCHGGRQGLGEGALFQASMLLFLSLFLFHFFPLVNKRPHPTRHAI